MATGSAGSRPPWMQGSVLVGPLYNSCHIESCPCLIDRLGASFLLTAVATPSMLRGFGWMH